MSGKDRVLLGQITGAHGIKGQVIVRSYTANPEDIAAYGPLANKTGTRTFELIIQRVSAKGVYAGITGVNDRTAAEALRGTELYVDRDAMPPEDDGEFYVTDLIGLTAVSEDKTRIGAIKAVHNFGAGDILEVSIDETGKTELIPFTLECVPDIDFDAQHATIIPPKSNEDDADAAPIDHPS